MQGDNEDTSVTDEKPPEQCSRDEMAGRTGLEPAASGVTGRRYNRLNYRPKIQFSITLVGEVGFEPTATAL
jgi:hypothetical protein